MYEIVQKSFPRPLEEVIERDISGEAVSFRIYHGVDANFGDQLIVKSKQPHILKATPGDAGRRFKDWDTLKDWLRVKRDVYFLTDGADMAGVIWHRPEPFPQSVGFEDAPEHTFAIRMYMPYEGNHLSHPFMDAALRDYLQQVDPSGQLDSFKGIWLSTDIFQEPGVLSRTNLYYERYGYREVGRDEDDIFMVLPAGKIRERLGR